MVDHYASWMLVMQFLTLAAALVGAVTGSGTLSSSGS